MADRKKATDAKNPGGNDRSSGLGGGKGMSGGPNPQVAKNARLKGEDPSPDNRKRGEVSPSQR